MQSSRRRFLLNTVGASAALATGVHTTHVVAGTQTKLGDSELFIVSDGHLTMPLSMILPESIDEAEKTAFLDANKLNLEQLEPACNLTLLKHGERVVLFDVGAGPNFMPSAGKCLDDLAELGIDPEDITDVVFTHAHPDHIWGLVDDFDELAFPNASYYMNEREWDFWWDDNTVNTVPETMQSMAVGAKNRMEYLKDQINLFGFGDEVLPNIEAIDTHGHTPGHTSFALHRESESLIVLGDALTHPIFSVEKAQWPWGTDQDPEAARKTRLALLDRLAGEQSRILGYHFPHPGLGSIEANGSSFRYVQG